MKTIGIIDADLLAQKKRNLRFPNLACLKLAGFHRQQGDQVTLLTSYDHVLDCDKVYISSAFTKTIPTIPLFVRRMRHVECGGTGFYSDTAAPPLPTHIEHCRPDYDLYDQWMPGTARSKYFADCAIGYLTRGCPRRCPFCVNRDSRGSVGASPLHEFYDRSKTRICLLDDNILACNDAERILEELIAINKPFQFKQGLDVRLVTEQIAKLLQKARLWDEVIFAFDRRDDAHHIRRGLETFRSYLPHKAVKFYVLGGFYGQDWQDIALVFRRVQIVWEYNCIAFVMKHKHFLLAEQPCQTIYQTLARWCNKPQFQRKMSFREFSQTSGKANRGLVNFERRYPDVAKEFFDMRYTDHADRNSGRGLRPCK